MSKASKAERAEAIAKLRKELKPGMTVHTILRHVSKSGMSRRIDVVLIKRNDTRYLTWLVAKACGYRSQGNGEGVVVGGCGMDMGFEVVYNIGRALWPKGFRLAKGQYGRNGDTSGFDNDGGYALKQRWI